ncbi:MAG TPA: D-aminoacylase [Terriglobales bacterium]|nr:D-aminoacylase [Terriglobales bacterium]
MKTLAAVVLLLCSWVALAQSPASYDILIRNGHVIDGTGNPWVAADVGIAGGKVVFVGRAPANATAKRTIDAAGMIVAPGFIDMLGQSEAALLIDKRGFSKITQGITTEITGEGGSIAPQNDKTIAPQKDYLQHYRLNIDWTDLDGYFRRLQQQGSALNLGTYIGAAQLREYVIGDEDRAPTAAELQQMQQLMETGMKQGAMGVSSALIYAPGNYAKTDELIALAKVASRYGGIYASHMRNEGDMEPQALDEAFRIGREANIPVEIFHLKVSGRQNWGKMKDVVSAIESARREGVDVTADQYPYLAGATSLGATIPPKYHNGGTEAFLARLKDPATRKQIRTDLESTAPVAFENFWHGAGPQGILVAGVLSPQLKQYEGKYISQIAQMQNKDPLDALMDLVIADHDNVAAIYFIIGEDDMKLAMKQPWVSVGTDHSAVAPDGPLSEGKAHPRGYGSFPRILGKYVREQHVLTLEDAIRKFTSLPAQREKLHDRGEVKPGYFADITIFDPQKVDDVATYENPAQQSVGIEYVLVNGVVELEHGKLTGQLGGRPLRGPGYQQTP